MIVGSCSRSGNLPHDKQVAGNVAHEFLVKLANGQLGGAMTYASTAFRERVSQRDLADIVSTYPVLKLYPDRLGHLSMSDKTADEANAFRISYVMENDGHRVELVILVRRNDDAWRVDEMEIAGPRARSHQRPD
jgi:hypothetical protein